MTAAVAAGDGDGVVPSVQSILQQQHAKRTQQHHGATLQPVAIRTPAALLRRSSSFPALAAPSHYSRKLLLRPIFKLRIENSISHTCWLVLRRYTDFVRLNNKLRTIFPHCNLVLPRKKWFGDNFSSGFIDNRIQGLQTFINTILGDGAMRTCQAVRDFFCLDEPPSYSESMEESRVIFEAQEETISQLKQQLQAKEDMVQVLQTKLATELNRNAILSNVIRNSVENCAKCSKSVDQVMKESVHK
uniref:PX domain-containing protein n=1 Tax=Anopheles farauti TaxID=69004 RepID=A0A182QT55_9DIPT